MEENKMGTIPVSRLVISMALPLMREKGMSRSEAGQLGFSLRGFLRMH